MSFAASGVTSGEFDPSEVHAACKQESRLILNYTHYDVKLFHFDSAGAMFDLTCWGSLASCAITCYASFGLGCLSCAACNARCAWQRNGNWLSKGEHNLHMSETYLNL